MKASCLNRRCTIAEDDVVKTKYYLKFNYMLWKLSIIYRSLNSVCSLYTCFEEYIVTGEAKKTYGFFDCSLLYAELEIPCFKMYEEVMTV